MPEPKVTVARAVKIPDELRLERYRRNPEFGPAILFFSGGSALKDLSRDLTRYTKNSIHLLTPFDSGGSSAKLREAFSMPAVGDMRSRLMALADYSITGNPEVYTLANHRLPFKAEQKALRDLLDAFIQGEHHLIREIPNPLQELIRLQLRFFMEAMPDDFDLRGASVGNLILTGGYLNYKQHLDPILYLFSKLLAVQGVVRPVTDDNLHLNVKLASGETLTGQHRFTGKECPPICSPIQEIWLSASLEDTTPVCSELPEKIARLIQDAELICYPPGSFYSSLIANLLPEGVAEAIAGNTCPKVYVPNLGDDPEQFGMTLGDSIDRLLGYLIDNNDEHLPASRYLNIILLDPTTAVELQTETREKLAAMEIQVIATPLIDSQKPERYCKNLLAQALLSLC